jgi:retron-type reverse transcriptase
MKRYGRLYARLCSYEHLLAAAEQARKGKARQKSVAAFYADIDGNLLALQRELLQHTYRTSPYHTFTAFEPKKRTIYCLPFRDRVVQWAAMLLLEPIWVSTLTRDTYASLKGRGIHGLYRKLAADLKAAPEATKYCLKLDVRKFYPSIDHALLKRVIRRKLKDGELLQLLDGIIDSVPDGDGVPIGSHLSQYFANLYLSELDHLLKERYGVRYYYRYADDMVLLAASKEELHGLLVAISDYLHSERLLDVKRNYQVFPVAARGIDVAGYVFYHTHVLVRKRNKQALARELSTLRKRGLPEKRVMREASSRIGFAQHCNSKHLFNTLKINKMKKFSEVATVRGRLEGSKLHIDAVINRNIRLLCFDVSKSKHNNDSCLTLQYEVEEKIAAPDGAERREWVKHISFTGSKNLIRQLEGIPADALPIEAMVIKQQIGDTGKFFYKLTDPA